MIRALGAALALSLAACGGTNVSVEFTFPDADSRELTQSLAITAVEPFVAGAAESGRARVLLKCGELGVFAPTVKVNRDQSDLPNLNVLLQRESHELPLDGDWAVDLERFKSSEETNPWRAVMVHIEARGDARKYEGGLAPTDETKTLLEGCFCMRLDENATFPDDPKLDEEVKAACPSVAEAGPRQVSLEPVAAEPFKLIFCGPDAVTAPRQRQAVALPGVCIDVKSCKDSAGGPCFRCATDKCTELDDKKNVPIRVRAVQQTGAAKEDPRIILTNRFGAVVPQAQVDDCASPITLEASIVGSVDAPLRFSVTCVDSVDFTPRPTDVVSLGGVLNAPTVAAISTIPADETAGTPARVAVLLSGGGNSSVLEVYEASAGRLALATQLTLPPAGAPAGTKEIGYGLLGFHYDLARKQKPLLAVVTSRNTTPVVRVMRFDEATRTLVTVRETDKMCGFDACAGVRECSSSRPCAMPLTLGSATAPLSMAYADRNGDGLADFTVATDRDFQVITYYSHPSSPDAPPPLDMSCECAAYGRGMQALELLSLGGPPLSSDPTGANLDLLMGDGTGAYVRYAQEPRVDAQPCSMTSTSAAFPCPAGLRCTELCPGVAASARCVEDCNAETLPCANPERPSCVTFATRPDGMGGEMPTGPGYCGRPSLGCRSPSSVWRLVTIHDVARAHVRGDQFEDAVAVGAGSPVPSSSGGGLVRIMYGGTVDLTALDASSETVRRTAAVELPARRLRGADEAQSPRGVEIGDINGDGRDDIAAIYTSSEEIRVWLGGGNEVPGELGQAVGSDVGGRIRLNECGATCGGRQRCFPFQRFAVADLDRDGKDEIAAICVPDADGPRPELKWFVPQSGI